MRNLLFLLLFLPLFAGAQSERFNDFRATIRLAADGDVTVTERIRVTATGDQIKRGITRPLRRKKIGADGERGSVDYEVISASRNGASEDFHTKSRGGFRTVYLGNKKRKLSAGTYDYKLVYTSGKQVYFTEHANELRWSVFSSDVRLPVDAAVVEVELPAGLEVLTTACYTGAEGDNDQTGCEVVRNGNVLTYTLRRPLAAGEGMTLAAAFPTGSFSQPPPPPPTPLEQNGTLWFSLAGILIALGYGYKAWRKYGIDPSAPPVTHQFTPPRGLSPASISYINAMYANQHQLTASLTALAVKGYLKIDEEKRSGFLSDREIFVLRPQDKTIAPDLPPEQAALYAELRDAGEVELDGEFDERLKLATDRHNESLKEQHKDYIMQGANGWKILPYFLIMLLTVIVGAFFLSDATTAGKAAFGAALLFLLGGTGLFAWLIQQPSEDKVALWAEIKGLRQYLNLNEEKRRALPGAPAMTDAYFQSILPYAIALGIENNWAADLASDVAGTLAHDDRAGFVAPVYFMSGFGNRMNTAYQGVSTPAASGGGFSGGGGGVAGGGGGSGGW